MSIEQKHNNRVNSDGIKLRRFALHFLVAGDVRRYGKKYEEETCLK